MATGDPGSAVFVNIPTGNGTFAIARDAANTGSAVAGASSVSDPANPSAWDGGNYSIVFTAPDAYEVRDSGGAVLDSGSYDADKGGSIAFRGAQVAFSGDARGGRQLRAWAPRRTAGHVHHAGQHHRHAARSPTAAARTCRTTINTQSPNLDQAIDPSRARAAWSARA